MEEKRMGRILVCRLTSVADDEYATRAARDLVRKNLTLLPAAYLYGQPRRTRRLVEHSKKFRILSTCSPSLA